MYKKDVLKKIYKGSYEISVDCIGGQYFINKGFKSIPKKIRVRQDLYEPASKEKHPAILATITSPKDVAVGVQVTYLSRSGFLLETKRPRIILHCADLEGSAIRLFEPENKILGVALSIEDAMAIRESKGTPVWAAPSADILETFRPPPGVDKIVLFSRNDDTYAVQKAVYSAAHRISSVPGMTVLVAHPPILYRDWMEEWDAR